MIRVTCEECGDIALENRDVGVRVCIEDGAGSYHFKCPKCGMAHVKPADPRIVDLLVASGVERVLWHLPAEMLEGHSGPPINHDDLLDFHALLQDEDWVDQVQRGEPA